MTEANGLHRGRRLRAVATEAEAKIPAIKLSEHSKSQLLIQVDPWHFLVFQIFMCHFGQCVCVSFQGH